MPSPKQSEKLAQSSPTSKLSERPKLNLLIAYPYFTDQVAKIVESRKDDIRLLVDSGAFTAWKAGKTIDVRDYAAFIKNLPVNPWRYFSLDVIGNPEASFKNYETLLGVGLSPIPVFTRGDDIKMIDRYYETSDVIGLGGLVGTKRNQGFVKAAMAIIAGRKVHLLGFTREDFLSVYRPYSCDTSSWSSGIRFGTLSIWDSQASKLLRVPKLSMRTKPPENIFRVVRESGEDPSLLGRKAEWINTCDGRTIVQRLPIKAHVAKSLWLSKRGIKYFLAVTDRFQIKLFIEAFDFWRSK